MEKVYKTSRILAVLMLVVAVIAAIVGIFRWEAILEYGYSDAFVEDLKDGRRLLLIFHISMYIMYVCVFAFFLMLKRESAQGSKLEVSIWLGIIGAFVCLLSTVLFNASVSGCHSLSVGTATLPIQLFYSYYHFAIRFDITSLSISDYLSVYNGMVQPGIIIFSAYTWVVGHILLLVAFLMLTKFMPKKSVVRISLIILLVILFIPFLMWLEIKGDGAYNIDTGYVGYIFAILFPAAFAFFFFSFPRLKKYGNKKTESI